MGGGSVTSAVDKIRKLQALMNDPTATANERATAKAKIAALQTLRRRRMSDAELADAIPRLKHELNAVRTTCEAGLKQMAESDIQRGWRFGLAVHEFYHRELER